MRIRALKTLCIVGMLAMGIWNTACTSSSEVYDDTVDPACTQDADCPKGEKCIVDRCLIQCRIGVYCDHNHVCVDGACVLKSEVDGDKSQTDGDASPDGDHVIADGDKVPTDGDKTPTDGDTVQTDGDTFPTDGDIEWPEIDREPEAETGCANSSDCNLGSVCIDKKCQEGCLSVRDCPPERVCTAEGGKLGNCVECTQDKDCTTSEVCRDNRCRFVCAEDKNCTSSLTPYCDPDSKICVACLSDSQCAIGTICMSGACVTGCRTDRDCAQGSYCDASSGPFGTCYACVQDRHCSNDKVCVDHACVVDCSKVQCSSPTPYCLESTGGCVQCLLTDHCQRGKICKSNACVEGCTQDLDCLSGKHCKTSGNGQCVECLTNEHCSSGKVCSGDNTCVTGECATDANCGTGKYCHPVLHQCYTLPADSCSSDNECLPIPLYTTLCDPLTRTCIDGCILGIFCLQNSSLMCVGDYCYECATDANCQGTACLPFDNSCKDCTGDDDCLNPDWHCKTDSGNCYECLSDAHCPTGKVCDPESYSCVECLENADCMNALKPICGKDKTCIPPCSNDCVKDSQICDFNDYESPIGYRVCGDYDNDPCTEYSSVQSCPSGQSCEDGSCVCQYECTEGQKACDQSDKDIYWSCAEDSYGCIRWMSYYCTTYKVCSAGNCVCPPACTQNSRRCISGDTKNYEICQYDDYYSGCYYWSKRACKEGTTCSGSSVCPVAE